MSSTSTLESSIDRALLRSVDPAEQAVHFHLSSDGHPSVCDVHVWESAAPTLGELRMLHQVPR